jgi:hypothetical protein
MESANMVIHRHRPFNVPVAMWVLCTGIRGLDSNNGGVAHTLVDRCSRTASFQVQFRIQILNWEHVIATLSHEVLAFYLP